MVRQAVFAEAQAAALQTETNTDNRVRALVKVATQLTEPARSAAMVDACAVAEQSPHDYQRSSAIAILAPHLPRDMLARMQQTALAIAEPRHRLEAIDALAPGLPRRILEATVVDLIGATAVRPRARALCAVAPALQGAQRRATIVDALRATKGLNPHERFEPLLKLARDLPRAENADAVSEALSAASTTADAQERSARLARLSVHLEEPQRTQVLAEALRAAYGVDDLGACVRALTALIPLLCALSRSRTVRFAFRASAFMKDASARAPVLMELVRFLPEDALSDAVVMARCIARATGNAAALAAVAGRLPEREQRAVGTEALGIAEAAVLRSDVLRALAPHAQGELLLRTLACAVACQFQQDRAEALVALAPYVPKEAMAAVLAAAGQMSYPLEREKVLVALAPYLPDELLADGVKAAASFDEFQRPRVLGALAMRLPEPERANALEEAVAAAQRLRGGGRMRALAALAPQLREPRRTEVLAAGLDCAAREKLSRNDAGGLSAVGGQLSADLTDRALAVLAGIADPIARAEVLGAWAPACGDEAPSEMHQLLVDALRLAAADGVETVSRTIELAAPAFGCLAGLAG